LVKQSWFLVRHGAADVRPGNRDEALASTVAQIGEDEL